MSLQDCTYYCGENVGMSKREYAKLAINEAYKGIKKGHGGPFGAVVVKDGKVIGSGHNMVLKKNDPTLHGEVVAIKKATKKIKDKDLSGSILYTSAEPCLMCLGACLWANIDKVIYVNTVEMTNDIGFRDDIFDKYLTIDRTKLKESKYLERYATTAGRTLFKYYQIVETQRY